ncbi:AAA family ATPase [Lederbergia panacisoli]|uniref:AAA family ATPase n=1 Tax=Lederbergia panacisoli TaxID=1255251 RepID=UPI00214B3526|nr:AAA family ATPase [Lederbergia panacisoli]MCR2823186.1 AAA family ATPase [Lederbergia panacisoli]
MEQDVTKTGKVIAVCSAKGGVGQTMIASNLAIALHKQNLSIALVDGKLQFGDIAVALNLRTSMTIKDVAEEFDSIDHTLISNYMFEHESGIHVLPAPDRPEYAELITKEIMVKTITMLQQQFDYIIIDCGYAFHETTLELLDLTDEILVATTLEMISLRNTKQLLETFAQLDFMEKTKIIVNRYDMESLIKAEDVPVMLNVEEAHYISNDFKLTSQSLNIGIPILSLRSRSAIAKDIFKLSGKLFKKTSDVSGSKVKAKRSVSFFKRQKRGGRNEFIKSTAK